MRTGRYFIAGIIGGIFFIVSTAVAYILGGLTAFAIEDATSNPKYPKPHTCNCKVENFNNYENNN